MSRPQRPLRFARPWLFFLQTSWCLLGLARDGLSSPAGTQMSGAASDATVDIEYDEHGVDATAGGVYAAPIEQIFKNPTFASGIASGTDALNRSLETLMDSIFYGLLDNEIRYDVEGHAFSVGLQRDLYSTPSGSYVVVDRLDLGPRYNKPLWTVENVPVILGADGSVNFLQIYLRNDGMRVAERDDLPPWRRLANDWFGLLPMLSRMLPPSFNPNELYDPIKQLETPFVFPFSLESFHRMAVGSIRSYALSGGVNLGVNLLGFLNSASREALENLEALTGRMPYSIFVRGEHRINVLKRDANTAWIGLNKTKRIGQSLGLSFGDRLFVLRGAIAAQAHGSVRGKKFGGDWVWAGVPLAMFPFDLSFEGALADVFDQVYEYDLRESEAQQAYLRAVKGDFAPSRISYLETKEKGRKTGVTFHFTRFQDRVENAIRNGPNIGVFRKVRENARSRADIEITDGNGKFYVLEGKQTTTDKTADILVGEEERLYQGIVELNVQKKVSENKTGKGLAYTFSSVEEPMRLTLAMTIQDGYVTSKEYRDYINDVRFFTLLPLESIPKIETQDALRLAERRQRDFFVGPQDEVASLHVMPTYLGRFGAQIGISLSNQQIDHILNASEDAKWLAFAETFGVSPSEWATPEARASLMNQTKWFGALALYPLRLFNMRFSLSDAIVEASRAISALQLIAAEKTPLKKLEAFYQLFDADHPAYLTHAILLLTDLDKVPRSVTFTTQAKGSARRETKELFGKLNAKTFSHGPPFPIPSRYTNATQKMAAFYLDQPRDAAERPLINKIQVQTRELPSSVRDLSVDNEEVGIAEPQATFNRAGKQIVIAMQAQDLKFTGAADAPAKIYVRVEEGGKLKFGKLLLAEKVLDVKPLPVHSAIKMATKIFEFYLTGPLSPLNDFMLNGSVEQEDDFIVSLAISLDGVTWSDERHLEFRFSQGRLLPPQ